MKLLKIKHILPLSAAAITFVCSQSTAEASTIHTVKRMIHFGALVNNTAFQYNLLNRLIIKETIKLLLVNSYIFQGPSTQMKSLFAKTPSLRTFLSKLFIKYNREIHWKR